MQGANGDVADGARLRALALDIHRRAVLHVALGDVEEVAGGIVRGDSGERACARALDEMDTMLREARAGFLGIVDLEAEMVEAGGAARLARVDVEADIAVAHGDRALGARVGRRLHAKNGLVESAQQRVLVAHDGDVLELGGHRRWKVSRNSFSKRLKSRARSGFT